MPALCLLGPSLRLVPVDARLLPLDSERLHQLRADDILPEFLLLEQLEVLEGRAGVVQVRDIGGSGPILQVGEVRDKGGIVEEFLGCEMIQVEGVCEGLDELKRMLATK